LGSLRKAQGFTAAARLAHYFWQRLFLSITVHHPPLVWGSGDGELIILKRSGSCDLQVATRNDAEPASSFAGQSDATPEDGPD